LQGGPEACFHRHGDGRRFNPGDFHCSLSFF
jgi:hypothetical protein